MLQNIKLNKDLILFSYVVSQIIEYLRPIVLTESKYFCFIFLNNRAHENVSTVNQ